MEILRKYGKANYIDFPLSSFGTTDFNTTPVTFASGDVTLQLNTGSFVNSTNLPSYLGAGFYRLQLTDAEMRASSVAISIRDSGTKVWNDQGVLVKTFGAAGSGFYAWDLNTYPVESQNNSYYADIQMNLDNQNTQDEYTVTWFSNSTPVAPTSPQLQVIKRSDGTDQIPATGMTQIGSTTSYKYDATTTYRISRGESYLAQATATIDGSTRTWRKIIGRDT